MWWLWYTYAVCDLSLVHINVSNVPRVGSLHTASSQTAKDLFHRHMPLMSSCERQVVHALLYGRSDSLGRRLFRIYISIVQACTDCPR